MFKQSKRWIFAAFFAAIFTVLFFFKSGGLNDEAAQQPGAGFAESAPFKGRNAWMNIYQNKRKIGFSHSRYVKTDSGYQFDESVFMKLNTMGMIQDMGMKTRGALNADFSLASFSFDVSSGRFNFSARGDVGDSQLALTIESAGSRQELSIPLQENIFLPSGSLQAAVGGDLSPGKRFTVKVFDPITLGQEAIRLEIVGQEEIQVSGLPRSATKISMKYKGASQWAWVDAQGEILKEAGMLGITLERTTRRDALNGLPLQASQDLTRIASVASNVDIADPASLKVLQATVSGIQDQGLQLHGGRQHYHAPMLRIEKESIQDLPHSRSPDLSPAEREMLQPGPLIPSDHEVIRKLSHEIIAGAANDLQKVRRVVTWMQQHIQKRPVLSVPDALAVLENRMGDCNEHAVLFAALARAAGIPTQIEAGMVYLKKRFYYHAWNAVFIGKWITVDALFNQIPADVTHIRFVSGDPRDQLDILGLIGTIQIHIQDLTG